MAPALIAAALWVVAGALAAALPSRRNHWPAAWVLIATGLPILGWVWATQPWPIGLAVTAATASVLRWPLRRLAARIKPRP